MLNVQADLRERLEKSLGVPAYVNVPEKRPETFVVVKRNGGHRLSRYQDRPGVDIYSYAPTEAQAASLAYRASGFMDGLPRDRDAFVSGYVLCAEETLRTDPDESTDPPAPRWYGSYTLTTTIR